MNVGIPRETKVKENRVSCTPATVHMLAQAGHTVLVETQAGNGAGFTDDQYRQAGATIVPDAAAAWAADLVIKVKEPIASEYDFLRPGLTLFTYLHLAADRPLTEQLVQRQVSAIAYETVQVGKRLPLLEPMSEIAGRMASIVGAFYLSKAQGGSGVMPSAVPGVTPPRCLVLGAGTAGLSAARVAAGIGSDVTLMEIDLDKMRALDLTLPTSMHTLYSNEHNLREILPTIDLLIGAVLVPGAKAPRLVPRDLLRLMKPGAVLVDVAIDQGGCVETARPTTHEDPIYFEENVLHYCVANMPGAYARTATDALTNATSRYALALANHGLRDALQRLPELQPGLNTHAGALTCAAVGEAHGIPYKDISAAMD
jgi:alanine dehydrogenase